MYTINLTFKVPHDLLDEWKVWIQNDWQPSVEKYCAASSSQLHRLLGHDDENGATIIFQLLLPSRAVLNNFLENKEAKLHQQIADKWNDKVLFFQTILERIDPGFEQ